MQNRKQNIHWNLHRKHVRKNKLTDCCRLIFLESNITELITAFFRKDSNLPSCCLGYFKIQRKLYKKSCGKWVVFSKIAWYNKITIIFMKERENCVSNHRKNRVESIGC